MQLPKQLGIDHIEPDVRAALERQSTAICSGSEILIPVLPLTPALRKQVFYAKSMGELTIGSDAIDKLLSNERHGLQKVAGPTDRVSRLLIVTNDGSPRFYRQLEFLHKRYGKRVLICLLDVDSAMMGNVLGCKDTHVKAVLLNRKTSVVNVLKSLL
jgi:hypothetical protein